MSDADSFQRKQHRTYTIPNQALNKDDKEKFTNAGKSIKETEKLLKFYDHIVLYPAKQKLHIPVVRVGNVCGVVEFAFVIWISLCCTYAVSKFQSYFFFKLRNCNQVQ